MFLFCLSSNFVTRTAAQQLRSGPPPRVGVIGKYDDRSGNTWDGCGNHFLSTRASSTKSLESKFIFISNADGSIAWMNLNGHDTRLELAKMTVWYQRSGRVFARYDYRAGRTQITVRFQQATDYISDYQATIGLRNAGAKRQINASGLAQCD
jgi:hypothetical protein